eukprot:8876306-Pyramimonas_sp.AAC.1
MSGVDALGCAQTARCVFALLEMPDVHPEDIQQSLLPLAQVTDWASSHNTMDAQGRLFQAPLRATHLARPRNLWMRNTLVITSPKYRTALPSGQCYETHDSHCSSKGRPTRPESMRHTLTVDAQTRRTLYEYASSADMYAMSHIAQAGKQHARSLLRK